MPEGSDVKVDPETGVITVPADKVKDGSDVTAKAKDKSDNVSEEGKAKAGNNATTPDTQADKTNPTVPDKTKVANKTDLTQTEKDAVKKAIEDANKDKFPQPKEGQQPTKVEIGKDGTATITYPDGSVDTIPGTKLVEEKANTNPSDNGTTVDDSKKEPVEPTNDKQGTGVIVKNPDSDTKVTAEDEDGKDVPVTINPNTGEIEVTPGANVDGPIVVTIEDPDLPGGKTTIIIDVLGHSMLRDDNGNGYIGENGYNPDNDYHIFPGGIVEHDYTPTHPVKTVVPEKTVAVTPVRDTLWYVFHINEYEYEVVRNGVVTKRLMDVTPVLRNNRTMLPLRYVAEAIGADVKWDAKTRTATFTKDGLTASIQVDGNEIILSNGKTIKMDSKPLMLNNRVLVSVVNVANVFGLTNGNTLDGSDQDIEWQQEDKSATIYIRR